ncbi:sigma-70 family RNA polymerase sigma factor [Poriferisphaera sp. WC338]|uniref:sigma-70 family RNA polymerase sigma factor n=1 Tax=Poriferisphaera sp. WC338 TaxID=3425129 RepID=UPI003D815F25
MPLTSETIIRQLAKERGRILGYIWAIVQDEHLAEDVLQEVFIIACRKAEEVEATDDIHVRRWIRKIARYQALNAARKSKRSPLIFNTEIMDLVDGAWDQADANESETIDALRGCIKRLSVYAQQLITLRYVEGFSGVDLANQVDRKVETVYTALSRIHKALRECVQRRMGVVR